MTIAVLSLTQEAIWQDPRRLWFLNRGIGLITLLALTASVVLGVLSTVRWSRPGWPRFATQTLHRNLSLLAVVLTVAHAGAAIIDSFVPLGWLDLVIPFVADYHPFWTGLGTLTFDAMLLLAVTGLLRHRMQARIWRAIHLSSYPAWTLAVAHGLGMGTDRVAVWSLGITALCVGAVVAAIVVRLATWADERRRGAVPIA